MHKKSNKKTKLQEKRKITKERIFIQPTHTKSNCKMKKYNNRETQN